jgi:hypothetical protein
MAGAAEAMCVALAFASLTALEPDCASGAAPPPGGGAGGGGGGGGGGGREEE